MKLTPTMRSIGRATLLHVALPALALVVLTAGCSPADDSSGNGGTGGSSVTSTGGASIGGTGGASVGGTGGTSMTATGGAPANGSGGTPANGSGGATTNAGGTATGGNSNANPGEGGAGIGGAVGGGATGTAASGGGGVGGSAGSAGANGVGGNAGIGGSTSAPYNPCPPKGTVCRIEPTGDSITEGFRSSDYGGYRKVLFRLALQENKSITFVGSAPLHGPATVDGMAFPQQNEGIGGRRISSISQIIPATLTTNRPHIMLLQIGTNDFGSGATSMTSQLTALVDKILNADPNLLLVLAKITPTQTDATNNNIVKPYNDSMNALVKARADAGKHIMLVDMYSAFAATLNFKTALMSDDYHPKDAGYSVMADVWYAALKSLLP